MHSFLLLASLFKCASEPYEFAFATILFVFHQSQDLVPRSSHSLSWLPFWINFHPPWTNRSRDFCCVPGSSPEDPPFWKSLRKRPWGRGCMVDVPRPFPNKEYYLHPNMVKKGPLRWDEIFLLYSCTALWFADSIADPLGLAASLAIIFQTRLEFCWPKPFGALFHDLRIAHFQTGIFLLSNIYGVSFDFKGLPYPNKVEN